MIVICVQTFLSLSLCAFFQSFHSFRSPCLGTGVILRLQHPPSLTTLCQHILLCLSGTCVRGWCARALCLLASTTLITDRPPQRSQLKPRAIQPSAASSCCSNVFHHTTQELRSHPRSCPCGCVMLSPGPQTPSTCCSPSPAHGELLP